MNNTSKVYQLLDGTECYILYTVYGYLSIGSVRLYNCPSLLQWDSKRTSFSEL